MTRDQISDRVKNNLNDNGVFYSAEDINDSLQDGYAEVTAYTGCIFKATTINLVANLSYYDMGSLTPDFLAVTAVFNPITKQWLAPTNLSKLEGLRNDWEVATGNPFLFWPVNFRFMAIFPRVTVSSGTLYVFYRAHADTLLGTSTPQIPEEHQAVLENYVTGDLLEQAEEFTKASVELESYFKTIKDLRDSTRKFRTPDFQSRLA